jgi:hypothetical protein
MAAEAAFQAEKNKNINQTNLLFSYNSSLADLYMIIAKKTLIANQKIFIVSHLQIVLKVYNVLRNANAFLSISCHTNAVRFQDDNQ